MAFHFPLPPLAVFLIILVLPLVSPQAPALPSQDQMQAQGAMIVQACSGIANRSSCAINLSSELAKTDPQQQPGSALDAALKNTLDEARRALQMVSNIAFPQSENPREDMAVEDCKELLDLSVSEIAGSMSEMRRIRAGLGTTRNEENLKAWLSAALGNQDTCLEGFDGTDRRIEKSIRGSLMQINRLVGNVLTMYNQMHTLPYRPSKNVTTVVVANSTGDGRSSGENFPEWMEEEDQALLGSRPNPNPMRFDTVVAADGSGRYRTITDAIMGAPSYSRRRYVIYVKKGVYRENVNLKKKKTNIMLVGDGIGQTVVAGDRSFLQGWTTFRTATVAVSGKGFIARDMTFQNLAGPRQAQAVALRVDSDQSAFYRCSMEGYQDTLYSHSLRQFFRECNIYGTIDFIFGNGAAVLQSCNVFTRQPLPLQRVTVTAQGRKSPHQTTGFSFQDCRVQATQPTYLGRPWKQFSRTVFMNTYMSNMVQPRGWLEWFGSFALNTLYYGEYKNYGPGANLAGRVKWPGYHIIRDETEADFFTVGHFIDGMSWLPSTGIRFSAGLSG